MGNHEIERFLNHLALNRQVSPASQNQALCALIFLYRYVVKKIRGLNYSFTKKEQVMPIVLTHQEATCIIDKMKGIHWLIAYILYGNGLRINDALSLRIKDIDLENNMVFVFRGKGHKDRYSLLPKSLNNAICCQIDKVKTLHQLDLSQGYGLTSLPPALIW